MVKKQDEQGRIKKRVPGEYSNKIIGFRVTESEYSLVQDAKKKGLDPRQVVLREARKLVNDDKTD